MAWTPTNSEAVSPAPESATVSGASAKSETCCVNNDAAASSGEPFGAKECGLLGFENDGGAGEGAGAGAWLSPSAFTSWHSKRTRDWRLSERQI